MARSIEIDYKAEPTPARFHRDRSFFRGLMGPFGSGKSVACCVEIVWSALKAPAGVDDVRRSRWAVIRNTYPELRSTTIKTWQDWFPPEIAPIKWTSPIECFMELPLKDGTHLQLEVLFLALDRPDDAKRLLSLELTGIWFNEAREIPYELVEMATARVGRYPAKRMLPAGVTQKPAVLADTNPPDDDHWWYRLAEEEKPRGYAFFTQPPAILGDGEHDPYRPNPGAENVRNQPLGTEYWMQMIPGKTREWIRVHLQAEYGTTAAGRPVYPEYSERIHVAAHDLEPMRGLPLLLGMDMGLTPAIAIAQLTPRGQLRFLDELVVEERSMGVRQMVRDVAMPYLRIYYPGMDFSLAWGDPSGESRSEADETTAFDAAYEEGLALIPAPSNKFQPRREAVASFLTRMVDGEPGLLISPRCKTIRRGMAGRYVYEELQVRSPDPRYRPQPAKNWYSHIQDAVQYVALGVVDGGVTTKRQPPRDSSGLAAASSAGY